MNANNQQGGNKTMTFGKSKARMLNPQDKNRVTFRDVAGEEEAKESLQEIIDKTEEIKMQQKQIRQERRSNSIPNAGLPWTKEQEDLLVQLFKENITIQEIADSMKRSTNSISARLNKLGLIA